VIGVVPWKRCTSLRKEVIPLSGPTHIWQGCSTLLTDAPLGQRIESGESGSVSVLVECSGLISPQDIVAKTAYPGKNTWIATDAGSILLEGDIPGIMQCIFDIPMVSDCDACVARRFGKIDQVVCHLGGAAPEAGLGTSMQDIAGDADDTFDQVLPFGVGNCAGRTEYVNGPDLTPIARFGDGGVAAGRMLAGAGSFSTLDQGGLIIFQLDDRLRLG
jgi:hypothetical protein